jgi:predicted ATPase/class 3 adenylate cyclase
MQLPAGSVTFLFTDIEGSTRLAQLLGAAYRSVLTKHRRILRAALAAADGTELFTEGDSLFVVFADPEAALTACADAQRSLAAHDWPAPEARPLVRMGLHTGYAQPIGGEYASPEVHRAARIVAAAHGGQVLCSEATAQRVRTLPDHAELVDLGLHRLRGFDGRERLYQLVAPELERQFPRPRTLDASTHNLPAPVTSFVGRVAERRSLRTLAGGERLVTVVGAGGAGKTRLAVEVAAGLVGGYPDGVWFVDLARLADDDPVEAGVAAVLGLRPEPGRPLAETIAEHAANHRFLLLLDTCDAQPHAARSLVERLLSAGGGARVLATGREPLGLPGEVVWRIPPLPVAAGADGVPGEAVTLLLDRARAARGGRDVAPAELPSVDRIATALDGLPLALELAAARLRVLSAEQLAARLDDLLGALDAGAPSEVDLRPGDRHRSMQAAVWWSYRTLDGGAAALLRTLSVFAGPVELAAVERLHGRGALDPLAQLVDKSLVQAEPGADGARYRMPDPIRAYATRRLCAAGEEDTVRGRHVAWCLDEIRRTHQDDTGRPVIPSLYALDPLAGELRAALHWSTTGGSARQGFAVAAGLYQWWRERGLAREGRRWLRRLHDRAVAAGEPISERELAGAYHCDSLHAGAEGDHVEELNLSVRAEELARRTGDPGLLARVLADRGGPLLNLGRVDEADRACREAIAWAGRARVSTDALHAVHRLAELRWRQGALNEAADLVAGARLLERARPADEGRRTVDLILGLVALSRGDLVAAHDHIRVALASRMRYGFHSAACDALNAMAVRCALVGEGDLAVQLFGAAQVGRARLRGGSGIIDGYWRERQDALRATLGDARFDAAYARGTTLNLQAAVEIALAVEHPDLAVHASTLPAVVG